MMNRSEGLVRRVKARDTESNSGGAGSASSNYDQENKNEVEDEMEDCDSKETRLTLMEEVLLLGLKDKEVRFVHIGCLKIFLIVCLSLDTLPLAM